MVTHTGAHIQSHRAFFSSHFYKEETTSPHDLQGPVQPEYQPLFHLWTHFLLFFSSFARFWSTHRFFLRSLHLLVPPCDMLFSPRSAELLPSNPSKPDSVSFSARPTLSTLLKTAAPGNSFAVQWLGLHTSALGDTSVILGRGTKIF